MYTTFVSSYIRRRVKLIPLKSALGKTFLSLDLRISKNILHIGEGKLSKFKSLHTLSESKGSFANKQKAIVACFVKNVAFLLGHPIVSDFTFTDCQMSWRTL